MHTIIAPDTGNLKIIALLDAETHEQGAASILGWTMMQRHRDVSTPSGTSEPGALPLAFCMPAAMALQVLSTAAAAMTLWGKCVPLVQGRPDCLRCFDTVLTCDVPVPAGFGQRQGPEMPRMGRVYAIQAPARQLWPWQSQQAITSADLTGRRILS